MPAAPSALFRYSPQPRKEQPALSFRWRVDCEHCCGWGWYSEDTYAEHYCTCEAAKWRRRYDGDDTFGSFDDDTAKEG